MCAKTSHENEQDQPVQKTCPQCHSQMKYSAEHQLLYCNQCAYKEDFERGQDKIVEQDLNAILQSAQSNTFKPSDLDKKVIECQACHSQIMISPDTVYVRCSFCGSEKINATAYNQNLIQPQGIIPFKITQQYARDSFNKWIREGWFRPNALKSAAMLDSLKGIYLPFWTFDAKTYTRWSGEAGHYYYVTVERNGQQVQERRIEWRPRSGDFNYSFDDVLISGVDGIDRHIVEAIYPYNLKETINYMPSLMIGWDAQIYNVDLQNGYGIAKDKMSSTLEMEASRRLGGDTQRGLRVSNQFGNQTFKHLILPIWICTYMYNGKVFQFAVNGQTGKIEGEKPISWVKVFFFVLFLVVVIATIVMLTSEGEGMSNSNPYYY